MTPERWRQIEDLYHAALEREPAARVAFLAEVDTELRAEVESLLAQTGLGTALITRAGPVIAPTRLGPYRIEATIGAGGMGEVFRAMDTRLHRTVAIKTLPRDRVADLDRKRRFIQEARAASALNHPNIVTLHDIAEDAGIDYLVMEYVTGTSLDKLIASEGIPLTLVIDYAMQITSALATAHAAGIVHRDIKPANVMVTAEGNIKVLDFGLAKVGALTPGPEDDTRTIAPALTVAGMVMGTFAYMSPEQARGDQVDARTDLFSFGAVLYEMVTGRRAFPKTLDWTTPPVVTLPAELRPIVLKLIEGDRELRYQHASEVRTDLQRLKRDSASTASRAPTVSLKRRWVIAAAVVCAVLIGASYSFFRTAPKLTDKDTIVLADFRNTTGDPVFDETLRQGLAAQLEQSPFLSLISDQRIRKMLGLMKQSPDAKLTPEIAQEVCARSGSAAVLEGSLAVVGSQYVLGFRAKNCRNGDILDEEQIQVSKKEDVLNALSQIAGRFRARAGESLAMVKQHQIPLVEATTASLEALQAFSAAQAVSVSKGPGAAIPLFQRAVELDPSFALASASLGGAYAVVGESSLAVDSLRKAYAMRSRASDPEKYFISLNYEQAVTGNLEKAARIGEEWAQIYPRDVRAHSRLSVIERSAGLHDKSLEEASKAIAIDPDFVFGYISQARSYLILDRLEEAGKTFLAASDRKLDAANLLLLRYYVAFLRGDTAAMERQITLARGRPDSEDWITHSQALVAAYSGRLQLARSLSRHAADLALQSGQHERAATFEGAAALYESLLGSAAEAKARAEAALKLSQGPDLEYGVALALAKIGNTEQSRKLAGDLNRRFSEDTLVQFQYLPVLRSLAALNEGSPARAIQELRAAERYETAFSAVSLDVHPTGATYPAYVRGEAFLAEHKGVEAAAEFQKFINRRGIVLADPAAPLARLETGRAWHLAGDDARAKAAYQDFLALWKNADDLPILKQAREENSKLR